ncbi:MULTISPECIES: CAP domain-containing protein [unclassified Oceanobacillus]|uniref:CAP domain-containing protein n=1 Tax=unclassified Oceanobacillus TaxID=2630292 RepID=UPI00300DEB9D
MRILRSLVLLTIVVILAFYWIEQDELNSQEKVESQVVEKALMLQAKSTPVLTASKQVLQGDLYHWIGKPIEELEQEMGEPVRKDLSAYGYIWWVYTNESDYYIQFGIEDDHVQTIYAIGNGLSLEPIQLGASYESIREEFPFKEEVGYTDGYATYTFRMTAEDMIQRPLVKVSDDLFMQFYFDTFTNELSSVRLMEADVLLRHQPYEVVYRGPLPAKPDLTDNEWSQVEKGMEQQIFNISNVLRNRFDKSTLEWEEDVSGVAYNHSKDMNDNNYFSHYSLNGDGLKERLEITGLLYISAGENIAAQYPDAPAAVEGWLNSDGHREALLQEEYTHLGVGVYRFYYTQNFLAKPM